MENSTNEFIDEVNKVNEAMDVNKIEKDVESKSVPFKSEMSFEDFMKADIRICEVISLEKVEGKDRLYKIEINTGVDKRVVVSAIAHKFTPEQILNKKFPFILNLPPRKIASIESNGMIILSSGTDDKYYIIGDENAEIGAIVV